MNINTPAVRAVALVTLKTAVNASILVVAQMIHDPVHNNFHTAAGWRGIAWSIGSAILAREAAVWGPKLLAWSNS
jgi:hypothetical protein